MKRLIDIFDKPSAFDSRSNYAGEVPADNLMYIMSRTRDADCLSESNWRSALKQLGGESESVQVIRFNHWAVGWIEYLCVIEGTKEQIKGAEIVAAIDDYPVLDEDDFSELERVEADTVWANCYNVKERVEYVRKHRNQFEFRSFSDLISCIRGQYFIGYACELLN